MSPEAKKLLFDIRDAGEAILSLTKGRSSADYLADRSLRSSCQWEFAVIGEAVGRLREHGPELLPHIREWQRIVAFRNQLVHGYAVIRNEITWDIIRTKLPLLVEDVTILLDKGLSTDRGPSVQ